MKTLTRHHTELQPEVVSASILLRLLSPLVKYLQLPDLSVDHKNLLKGLAQPLLCVMQLLLGEGSLKPRHGGHCSSLPGLLVLVVTRSLIFKSRAQEISGDTDTEAD